MKVTKIIITILIILPIHTVNMEIRHLVTDEYLQVSRAENQVRKVRAMVHIVVMVQGMDLIAAL